MVTKVLFNVALFVLAINSMEINHLVIDRLELTALAELVELYVMHPPKLDIVSFIAELY